MAIKLGNITDWQKLDGEKLLVLEGSDRPRKVRIEVNCAGPTCFVLVREGQPHFPLGTVVGHDVIEFWHVGEAKVGARGEGGTLDAWFHSADGQKTHAELPGAVTFTEPHTRRARNPELERMQYLAEINMNRRLQRMQAEFERRLDAISVDPKTGEIKNDKNDPGPAAGNSKPPKANAVDDSGPDSGDEGEPAEPHAAASGAGDRSGKRPEGDAGPVVLEKD